jgi:chloramphenicol 3-O-phosphotransferase
MTQVIVLNGDVEVDTSHADPMECARVIAAHVT